jgi:hypothetical protein
MSITKLKAAGNWAPPINNNHHAGRNLNGRVIFGLLTGGEAPDRANSADNIVTSAKERRR